MTDALLINPVYNRIVYKRAKIKVGVPINPLLNLALLAAPVLESGFTVKILDLNLMGDDDSYIKKVILEERPKLTGITFTTPLFQEASRLARIIREIYPQTKLVVGGPHATTFPEELLSGSLFDIVAVGEADFVIRELLELSLEEISGIVFRRDGLTFRTRPRQHIKNLDTLPFPAWKLYDLKKYNKLSLSNKKSPPGYLETSRGCPWRCVFCNKNIQGTAFRPKSVKRVVDEIEYMLSVGFKEINFLDDTFSTDLVRAKLICEEIIKRDLRFPWHPLNGMRVDRLDKELLILMKKSGCYKVSFGIESGNQEVLNNINKGISLGQVYNAVKWTREVGLETFGYFMLGLPGETEITMNETIRLAKKLKLDIAKFNVTVPLPGTKIFEEWDKLGLIKTKDWSKYNFYAPYYELYNHPTLPHEAISKYYRKAYKSFYFSPAYLVRRLVRSLQEGILFRDIRLFFHTDWFDIG